MISLADKQDLLDWLLKGDVAIQYQVYRDLLQEERPDLQSRIATEGWGAGFLQARGTNGHWGRGYYQPKWISTHYTLLDLKNLYIVPDQPAIRESVALVLATCKAADGGVNPHTGASSVSDVCINGMILNVAAYFGSPEADLRSIVDFILEMQLPDGGFNCQLNRKGARHSSLHTTISIVEGIHEFAANGYNYRTAELQNKADQAAEFILQHRLFRSDRTGKLINKRFLLLSFPCRWYYDILRALDYFQSAGTPYDRRMQDALDILLQKQRKDKRWPVQGRHPGQTHFEMEKSGAPSRWNTLRALRVLEHFNSSS